MKIKFYFILIFSSLLLSWQVKNDALSFLKNDLESIKKNFESTESFRLTYQVKYFESKEDKTGTIWEEGTVVKSKRQYRTDTGDQTMIVNHLGTLIIDHFDKIIQLFDPFPEEEWSYAMEALDLKKLDDLNIEIELLENTKNKRTYRVNSPSYLITKMDFTINIEDKSLTEIVYYYDEGNVDVSLGAYKVVVSYKTELGVTVPSSSFSFNEFVLQKGKSFSKKSEYSNYELNILFDDKDDY